MSPGPDSTLVSDDAPSVLFSSFLKSVDEPAKQAEVARLDLGWSDLATKQPEEQPKTLHSPHPEVQAHRRILEAQAVTAEAKVVILVQSLGSKSGKYTVPYREGARLQHYLSKVGLALLATKNRVYDSNDRKAGRLRVTVVPKPNSSYLIIPNNASVFTQYQSTDDQRKAEVVEISLGVSVSAPAASKTTPSETDEYGNQSV